MSENEIANSPSNGTSILMAKATQLREAVGLKIEELLRERENIQKEVEARLEEIKQELKVLGYKAPRKKSEKTIDAGQTS